MSDVVCVTGPIERIDGKFVLMIPLDKGGVALADATTGISEIEGAFLKVALPDWLVEEIGLEEGDLVEVDNTDGMFNIDRADASDPVKSTP